MAIRAIAFPKDTRSFDPALGVRLTLDGACLRIGRASDSDLRLPDVNVSPHHASLVRRGDGYVLTDEGSACGTWVGGIADDNEAMRMLAPHTPFAVEGPMSARIGSFRLVLAPNVTGAADDGRARRLFAVELLARTLHQRGRYPFPTIYVVDGPDLGAWIDLRTLGGTPHLIGRGADVDVRLRDGATSRRHFEVLCTKNVWVRDVGSSGGTMLGGKMLEPLVPARWEYGTPLYAGRNVFAYEYPITEVLEELERVSPESPVDDDRELPPEGSERGPVESTIRPREPSSRGGSKPPEA